jgi:hypothetical protein
VVPRGDTVLEPGDEVLVLASPDSEDAVRSLLVAEAKPGTSLIAMLSDAATGADPTGADRTGTAPSSIAPAGTVPGA